MPLHGLGSDQVNSAENDECGVEAYYVDEHRFERAHALKHRLKLFTEAEAREKTIMLYVSPNSMWETLNDGRHNEWFSVFYHLARNGLIRLLVIDEAHAVEQAGRSFRTEFIDAVLAMQHLHDAMPSPVPRLAMSATFRRDDYKRVSNFFGADGATIMQGELSRRQTLFRCFVSGSPATSLLKSGLAHLKQQPDMQQLWYANSRSACEGALLEKADQYVDRVLRSKGQHCVVSSFTGSDGLKIETSIMDEPKI